MRVREDSAVRRWKFHALMLTARTFGGLATHCLCVERRFRGAGVRARRAGDWCIERAARFAARAYRWPLVVAVAAGTALAAPPPVGSEDWEIMAPFSDWIRELQHEGILCCTMADGRPVQARTRGETWQVRWRPGQLANAPTDWVDVPEKVILRIPNPIGMPIAFYLGGQIRCFVPPGAI